MAVYVDGVQDATSGTGGAIDNDAVNCELMRRQDASQYFDGLSDDTRIYSTALTSNEIARLTLDTCEMYDPTLITNSTLHSAASTWDTSYGNTNLVMYARGDMTGVGNGNAVTSAWSDTKGHTLTPYNSPTIEAAR